VKEKEEEKDEASKSQRREKSAASRVPAWLGGLARALARVESRRAGWVLFLMTIVDEALH